MSVIINLLVLEGIINFLVVKRGEMILTRWALCYKLEGREFEARCSEWIFSNYLILVIARSPGVYSASNKNEYQKQKNVWEPPMETSHMLRNSVPGNR
jgi:hypothetical protein